MAGNNAIQFLRKKSIPSLTELQGLLPGQPLYDMANNKLYLGIGNKQYNSLTSQLETDIGNLETGVANLEANVGTLNTDVTQAQTDITNLKSKDSDIERRLTNLGFKRGSFSNGSSLISAHSSSIYRQGNYILGEIQCHTYSNTSAPGTYTIGKLPENFRPVNTLSSGSFSTSGRNYVGVWVSISSGELLNYLMDIPLRAGIDTSGNVSVVLFSSKPSGASQKIGCDFYVCFGFEAPPITD